MRDLTKDDDTKVFIIMQYKCFGITRKENTNDAYRRLLIIMCW